MTAKTAKVTTKKETTQVTPERTLAETLAAETAQRLRKEDRAYRAWLVKHGYLVPAGKL